MSRAERRREQRQKNKLKHPAIYNFTIEQIREQVKKEVGDEYERKFEEIKQQASDEAVNTAMTLLFVLPLEVLMDFYWKKTYAKKIPEFTQHLLDYYTAWQNGELDMDVMKKDLWEYGGIRLEESD